MAFGVETVIRHMINQNNQNINISFPAIIVGVDNLKEGFIDVQPVVNYINPSSSESSPYPVINDVSIIFPNSQSTSICFPVKQGDFVSLLFQTADIQDFIMGSTEPHEPAFPTYGNLANVVAIVGFTPYQQSPFNPINYSGDFDNQALNIVHNKNTGLESSLSISTEGSIQQKAPNAVSIDSPLFDVKSDVLNANSAVISTAGDVVVKGQSVNQFMVDLPKNIQSLKRGYKGWTPVLSVEDRNTEESVLKISDWVDGEGDKPTASGYVSASGIVDDINKATNIKGAKGKSGAALSEDVIKNIVNNQFTVGAILDLIQGQIDESALTKYLTSKIDKIEYNELAISQETQARIDSILDTNGQISIEREQRLYDVLALKEGISTEVTQRKESDESINSRVDTVVTKADGNTVAIQQEATARIEADTAIGSRIDTVVSNVDNNTAAIISESTTRADEDSALSTRIETVSSKTNTNTATITSLQETITDELGSQAERIEIMQADYKPRYADKNRFADSSRSTQWTYWKTVARDGYATNERIEQLKSDVGKNNASITESLNTLVTTDKALATSIENLRSTVSADTIAAIQNELSVTTSKTDATASSVNTLQTTVAGNTASIETAQSSIDGINLQYTVKLDSGGKVSGFGLMNDGATSAFDVRADRFSISAPVGNPNDINGTSPFMVLTNQQTIDGVTVPAGVYARNFYAPRASIDTIQIKDAAIKTAKIDNLAVKSAQIDNLAVTSGKIAELAVDTLHIAGNAVTIPQAVDGAHNVSLGDKQSITAVTVALPTDKGVTAINFNSTLNFNLIAAQADTVISSTVKVYARFYENNVLVEGDTLVWMQELNSSGALMTKEAGTTVSLTRHISQGSAKNLRIELYATYASIFGAQGSASLKVLHTKLQSMTVRR